METGQLKLIFQTLDDVRHENGIEYWYAKELYPVLGYPSWEKFLPVVEKAKNACKNSGSSVEEHFIDVKRIIGAEAAEDQKIEDIKLSRFASYMVTINGDPRKQEIAVAQAYFVTQTRKIELIEQRMHELQRLDAREKLKVTEKEFSALAFARGVDGSGIARIRSRGDEELFGGKNTDVMKGKFLVSKDKPLADVLPNVTLKAKDLATAMTTENARRKNLFGLVPIGKEHVNNNKSVRSALVQTGIYLENLPPAEDIKRIEARHRKEYKELQQKQRKELENAAKKLKS